MQSGRRGQATATLYKRSGPITVQNHFTPDVTGWSEPVKQAIVKRNVTAAGVEILRMNAGFRVLPVERDKRPVAALVEHGVLDATDDPQRWRQWCALVPDCGLGIVPGQKFAILDDDGGNLDPARFGVAGTYAEHTRRGKHHWVQLPSGRKLRRAKVPEGDVLTGDRCYVIAAPTEPYAAVDVDAPFLMVPDDSVLWDLHARQTAPSGVIARSAAQFIAIAEPSDEHSARAKKVVRAMVASEFGEGIKKLLAGDTSRYPSASEADCALAFAATAQVMDPQVILAVLLGSNLRREKWQLHSTYLSRQINGAIAHRQCRNAERRDVISLRISAGHAFLGTERVRTERVRTERVRTERVRTERVRTERVRKTNTVVDATGHSHRDRRAKRNDLIADVIAFAAVVQGDEFERIGGWRRFPVADVAVLHGMSRESVRRALLDAERFGLIERRTERKRHDGGWRADSLIRLLHVDCLDTASATP